MLELGLVKDSQRMTTNPEVSLSKGDLTDEQLKHYQSKEVIAIDGEMMGLDIHRDRLCLVQIGDEDRKVVLVQIAQGQTEAPNLKKLMEDAKIRKLFHFARTDVACLKHWLKIDTKNFFCTKVGSRLARTYTDKHSLREVVKEFVDKDLSKGQRTSDWGADTLTKDQERYAAADVYYLIPVYNKLIEMLEREGRRDLAETSCEYISTLCDLDILGYEGVLDY